MKSVLISGAASGIGKATKEYFLDNGYFVVLLILIKLKKNMKKLLILDVI